MRRRATKAAALGPLVKLGETYRDRRGVLVEAEDFEFGPRGRTGRVIVRAADGVPRFPSRWICRATELVETPEQRDLPLPGGEGGDQP
jgi:hypothetical protein